MSDEALIASLPIQVGDFVAGKYRVEALLAAGGMGAVFKAHHAALDQAVAIKVMRPELARRREPGQRFLREARAAAKIVSDYVGRVTDVDVLPDQTPFMVMEFLRGMDLQDRMRADGALPIERAVDYICEALAGLEAAHALGVVHRDLKPSNLFVVTRPDGKERVKILDFGISKVISAVDDLGLKAGATTKAGTLLGTPRYMSPEQLTDAKDVDGRTDIWALGLILYELLTAEYPFEADTAGAIMSKIFSGVITTPATHRPEIPAELERVVLSCLERERSARPPTTRALMKLLLPFASKKSQAVFGELSMPPPGFEDRPALELDRDASLAPGGLAPGGDVSEPPPTRAASPGALAAPPPAPLPKFDGMTAATRQVEPDVVARPVTPQGTMLSAPHDTPSDPGVRVVPPPARGASLDALATDATRLASSPPRPVTSGSVDVSATDGGAVVVDSTPTWKLAAVGLGVACLAAVAIFAISTLQGGEAPTTDVRGGVAASVSGVPVDSTPSSTTAVVATVVPEAEPSEMPSSAEPVITPAPSTPAVSPGPRGNVGGAAGATVARTAAPAPVTSATPAPSSSARSSILTTRD